MKVKMMKIGRSYMLFISIAIVVLALQLSACSSRESIMYVDFQEYFNSDTVSFSIEGRSVFENEILTSNKVDGLTGTRVLVDGSMENMNIKYRDSDILVPLAQNKKLLTKITLNGHNTEILIDVEKGRYIGIGKNRDSICLIQSRYPFEY